MIASLSGIRGILNEDLSLEDVARFCENFAETVRGGEVLVARDTRATGPAISKAAIAGLMSRGAKVEDCGVLSTPALFRMSRLSKRPAVMVTASHNEPQFNGLKFVVGGRGIGTEGFEAVVRERRGERAFAQGSVGPPPRPSYSDDLVARFGAGAFDGAQVALDLGGGAAIGRRLDSWGGSAAVWSR